MSEALGALPEHPWEWVLHEALKNSKTEGLSLHSSSLPHTSQVRQLIQLRSI